jgi:signal transduction histidine kinase
MKAKPNFRWLKIPLMTAAAAGIVVLLSMAVLSRSASHGLPYKDAFAAGRAAEWKALGGTWEVTNGMIRNDSDERGAKILAGSPYWRNYSIEADLMLLGKDGDAGLILRASKEEEGVDSYSGYYTGLRNHDNSLVLGRADHGWMENRKKIDLTREQIQPFRWYHLKFLAYGCRLISTVTNSSHQSVASMAIEDKECVTSGRIGLRSYSSGGVWKNIVVQEANESDLWAAMKGIPAVETGSMQPTAVEIAAAGLYSQTGEHEVAGSREGAPEAIGDLRLFPFTNSKSATVKGVVTLTSPSLIVQDSTGGMLIDNPKGPPLKIGDEVEVKGEVKPGDFSSAMDGAQVRLLWARAPTPAVSVTAAQAATGAFDATFIELEGYLRGKQHGPNNTLVLDFDAGSEAFRAIANPGRGDSFFKDIDVKSLVRLRGICVVDTRFTQNLTPFVLLLRSTDDVKVLAGPPWWDAGHLVALVIGALLLALVINFLYSRIEHSRLRAVLGERERLAHEMHDTLAQSFAGIGFQLDAIKNGVPSDLSKIHRQLDLATDLTRHSHEEARRSIATLLPSSLESRDLLLALDRCAQRMLGDGTVKVVIESSGDARKMPLRITDTLYRIGQEAIANAVRHARPTTITVSVEYLENRVRLLVADDGHGFTPAADLRGFGLQGMRRRAAAVSATLKISSLPGQGTQVEVIGVLPPRGTMRSWLQACWIYFGHPYFDFSRNRPQPSNVDSVP